LTVASIMFTVYAVSVVMESLKATEQRLKETAFLHALVTENSRDVIIIADFQGKRNYVSAAHASLGGWTREDLLNLHSLDLVHPDDRANAAALMKELRTGRGEAMLECRVRKQDGSYIWVEASLRTIRDPLSKIPTGILNIVRDISERKRAEQSRDFHQSLLGAIHDVSLDAILVVNDEGKAVSYNRRFAEVWQITARRACCNPRPRFWTNNFCRNASTRRKIPRHFSSEFRNCIRTVRRTINARLS
jgi:PAS domain S-box-containing protein